jgi:hypothetical protein
VIYLFSITLLEN